MFLLGVLLELCQHFSLDRDYSPSAHLLKRVIETRLRHAVSTAAQLTVWEYQSDRDPPSFDRRTMKHHLEKVIEHRADSAH